MSERTHLTSRPVVPVLAIRVEVVEGPDRGKTLEHATGDLSIGSAEGNALVLTDPTVSRFHAELGIRSGRVVVSDQGSTNGTRIGVAVLHGARAELDSGANLSLGRTRLRVQAIQTDAEGDEAVLPFGDLWGTSAAMRQPLADLARVARGDIAVLVQGESGTGKELAARALHERSARAGRPFVTVDCAAIAPQLVASELFGHERGAFTGAERRRIGAFEQAQGGTVFLDEVGELSPELQAMLLGVLERRRFRRVGGTEDVQVDIRLVSATHRDLRAAVNAGSFRLDLFYRVAAVRVVLPPLRERVEDLPALIRRFLVELGSDEDLDALFSHEDLVAMERHAWPGNVRELRNVVAGTLALGRIAPLDRGVGGAGEDDEGALFDLEYKVAKREILDRFERRYLTRLLERTGGNVRAASRESRLERNHLTELLRRHGLRDG
ncbi:MAG: sigma 54-interacting transcriptional regulator [Myxococcota bacterium]|nr:sigma 54-interacting transcriptional regulator [Myxococcota bacterium]